MRNDDLKLMAQAFNQMSYSIKNGDVLFMTTNMMCSRIKSKTILANECFYLFIKDFEKQGGSVKFYLTETQLYKELIKLLPQVKVHIRNKSYIINRGYCNITNYLKTITTNSQIDHKRKKNCSVALRRFNELHGYVSINGKYYSHRDPVSYKSL